MAEHYQVLARKYRSQTFKDLIGQDVLVQTLTNAIESKRLAHGYVLTGVRGVGKTSTARILAKALNCLGENGDLTEATAHPCGVCENCRAIAESRHVDVLEMDAASHTGVDNIREINDSVAYRPTSGRYKIYIIDEVHMLSKGAFNALLKTLEEPPAHVVFIFATTEIRKVPITILSRCQRFDLPRVDVADLEKHYSAITTSEGVEFEEDAIRLIAHAADGSVRDGLSLLDQAIALSSGKLSTDKVSEMLGLSDRSMIFELFEALCKGDAVSSLSLTEKQYHLGASCDHILNDLLDLNYWVMRVKISPESAEAMPVSATDKVKLKALAEQLSLPALARLWQMILKGIAELKNAMNAFQALQMILVRLSYLSSHPFPEDLLKDSQKMTDALAAQPKNVGAAATPVGMIVQEPVMIYTAASTVPVEEEVIPVVESLSDLLSLLAEKKEVMLRDNLERAVKVTEISSGKLHLVLAPEKMGIVKEIKDFLEYHTKISWDISITENRETQTISTERMEKIEQDDAVKEAAALFGASVDMVSDN